MEESELDFGEVEEAKSAIRSQALSVPATNTGSNKNSSWQYEVNNDPYENPPLFSQLRYHVILKDLELRNIEDMRAQLVEKYMKEFNVNTKNIFIKKIDRGCSANAYIGFQYDYEAYSILKQGNNIRLPLAELKGDIGAPKVQVTELFDYILKKNEEVIRQQMLKYQTIARKRFPSESSKKKSSEVKIKEYRPQVQNNRTRSRSSYKRDNSSRRRSRSADKYRKVYIPEKNSREDRYRERSYSKEQYRRNPRSSYSRSSSCEKSRRAFEPSVKSFNTQERSFKVYANQLEEGEISSGNRGTVYNTCYVYGIPFKARTGDVVKELKRRGLALPKDLQFIKKGNQQVTVIDDTEYLRMKFDKQEYIKDLQRREVKILGQHVLAIQCENEVLLVWE
jgi:hypothetical protein